MGIPVLAVDLATRTGLAFGDGCPPRTASYTLHTTGESRGPAFLRFNEWLFNMIGTTGAEILAYEAPIFGTAPTSAHKAMLLIGLAAQCEMIAAARNIQVVSVAVSTVRKHCLGTGRPKNPKRDVLDFCKRLGWETGGDHNRADAACLWMYVKSTHDRSFRVETGLPMFAGGAG